MVKKTSKKNKAFTLVELIVVLVILAILAAILIPAMLGYIDRAREKQDILNARNLLIATQAQFTEAYATGGDKLKDGDPVVSGTTPTEKNGDVDLCATNFAKKVLETADMTGENEPYLFMVAVGSNHNKNYNKKGYTDNKTTIHDKYTVYYAVYMKSDNDPPYYYYDGKWSKKNPRGNGGDKVEIFDEFNRLKNGNQKGLRLQYYLISNKTGKGSVKDGTFWDYLKKTIDEKWN